VGWHVTEREKQKRLRGALIGFYHLRRQESRLLAQGRLYPIWSYISGLRPQQIGTELTRRGLTPSPQKITKRRIRTWLNMPQSGRS